MQPGHGHLLGQDLLHLGIGLGAVGIGQGLGTGIEQRIHLGVDIAFDVVEGRALGNGVAGVGTGDTQRRIGVLVDIDDGHVEVPLGGALVPAGHIGAGGLHLDAGLDQVLADHLGQALPGFAIGQRQQLDGLALVAGLLEQGLGLVQITRVLGDIVGGELHMLVEGAGCGFGKALPGDLDHGLAVHRIHDGLAELGVVKGRLAVVEHQPGMGRVELPTLGGDGRTGQLGQARHIKELDRAARHHIDLARFKRRCARGRIRDDVEVEVLHHGLALGVVQLIGHQLDVGAPHPFLVLEGPRANRLGIRRVGGEVGVLVDVLGDHRHRAGVE